MEGLNGRLSTTQAAATFQSCPVSGTLCIMVYHETSGANYDIIESGSESKVKVKVIRKDFMEEVRLWLIFEEQVTFGLGEIHNIVTRNLVQRKQTI